MLSVIIPAKNEPHLNQTIKEVLDKSDADVYAMVEGTIDVMRDKRVQVVYCVGEYSMKEKINSAVEMTDSEYIMKLDAHCILAEGFDKQLIKDHQPNWIQIPRRYRLDAENWKIIEDGRLPVDYEFIIFQNLVHDIGLAKGFIWGMPWELKGEMIDDTPHFQGSCWFMTKDWFNKLGGFDTTYKAIAMEGESLMFPTIKNGGAVKVNKNTFYAHLHKDMKARQWFTMSEDEMTKSCADIYNKWVMDKEFFINFVERFPLMPGWPENWKYILYGSA